jgi:predicted nucleic acid-binding protein
VVFIDTNVLVYATVPESPWYEHANAALAGAPAAEGGAISRQVLREYLCAMSRMPLCDRTNAPLAAVVQSLEATFVVLEDGPLVTARLLDLIQQVAVGGRQMHDANLVATMLVHGVERLLTANTADFARFAAWIEVMPLERPG